MTVQGLEKELGLIREEIIETRQCSFIDRQKLEKTIEDLEEKQLMQSQESDAKTRQLKSAMNELNQNRAILKDNEKVQLLQTTNEELVAAKSSLELEILQLKSAKENLQQSEIANSNKIEELKDKLRDDAEEISELKSEKTDLQNNISSLEEQLRIQNEKNDKQTAAYSEYEREILSYLEDNEAKVKSERAGFMNNISSLEEQLRIQTERNNTQTAAYSECEREMLLYLEDVEARLEAQSKTSQENIESAARKRQFTQF
ncbi:hypothetical protein WMY93_015835 [Mugilogobius chulae]|uniref:Tropomyosin n=1 Tax=Mugilogobius chulae TaxID=88201 RepID=A0AAW0P3F0_9GOBI